MSTKPRAGAPINAGYVDELLKGNVANLLKGATSQDDSKLKYGPLGQLPGDWTGRGFSILSLPNNYPKNPTAKFQLMMNATIEDTQFTRIGAPIPDRGNTQDDIFFLGMTYLQKVSDAQTLEGIHIEPGLLLNLPGNPVQTVPSVVRLATIPHGDAVLAQGPYILSLPVPIPDVDSTPFTLNADGSRHNDPSDTYLAPFKNAIPPPGIPHDAIKNPNYILQQYNADLINAGKSIIPYSVFQVNVNPVGGIADAPPLPAVSGDVGGITNIPFVNTNANANSMSATFWTNIVMNPDASMYLVLQYSQTVILDFPVPDSNDVLTPIKWPHISVANLLQR
jgi:hypothetical protein